MYTIWFHSKKKIISSRMEMSKIKKKVRYVGDKNSCYKLFIEKRVSQECCKKSDFIKG